MTNEEREYRIKKRRCRFCKHHHKTPCGSIDCSVKDKLVFDIVALFCKYYEVPNLEEGYRISKYDSQRKCEV